MSFFSLLCSSPFFCVPFLFRVSLNPKRFFPLSFVPSFVHHHFTRKYLLTFVKMMMREEEEEEERETPSKARTEVRRELAFVVFISRFFLSMMVLFFCSLFLLSLLSNFEFSPTNSLSLSLSLLPPRFRIIKPLLLRNNNENESNSQRKLAHARLSRRRGFSPRKCATE